MMWDKLNNINTNAAATYKANFKNNTNHAPIFFIFLLHHPTLLPHQSTVPFARKLHPTLPCYFFSLQPPPAMVTNLQTSCRINHNKTKIKKKGKQLPCTMNSTTKLLLLLYLLTTTFYLTSTYSSSSSSSATTFSLLKPATSSAALLAVSDPTPGSSVDVKVYVYDLPPEYNSGWLADGRCSRHLFAAEVALHRAVTGSRRFRAADPSEADFFLVPVYVSCNFSAVNGFPALGHARGLLESAVRRVAGEMPYWNRSNGADHLFVASHDYGACFRAMV